MMKTSILLADDHQVVRQGLRALLEAESDFAVVGETGDGLEALQLVERLRPTVLVLDLMLPSLSGLEVARRTRRLSPHTRVVVLSMVGELAYVAEALRGGATAFVLKKSTAKELVLAIRRSVAGDRYLSPPLSEEAVEQHRQWAKGVSDPYQTLTRREREVLQLVGEGLTSAEIAGRLVISPRTVETHRRHLVRKLGLHGQAALVRFALQRTFPPPTG